MAFLSVDLGTSTAKALAFDESGQVLARAHATYCVSRPRPGWAEQDPEVWWRAVVQVIRSVVNELARLDQDIEAIGLTGQMHGLVLLGKDGTPIHSCILWMDTRAREEATLIEQTVGRERFLALTGNLPVAAFPAAKLLWLRRRAPDIHAKIRKILMPKDYLGFRLSGEVSTDPSDASGTGLYALRSGHWADELLEAVAVPKTALPPVVPSTERLGWLTAEAARQIGLRRGIPVFMGAGDLATAALGNGVVRPGRVGITLGTAGQVLFQLDSWPMGALGNFYLFAHPVQGTFLGLGTVPTGGASLHWVVRLVTGGNQPSAEEIARWVEQAKAVPPGAHGLIFLPYLAGTGTPYMDYQARGAFIGLTEVHGPAELVRAVLEGVAYSLRDSLEVLHGLGVEPADGVRMAGGATVAGLWVQVVAEVIGCEVRRVVTHDASSVGAFLLAAVGSRCFDDLAGACEAVVQLEEPVKPSLAAVNSYQKGYRLFRLVYAELAGSLRELHAWDSGEDQ